jgi:hypothetical protein
MRFYGLASMSGKTYAGTLVAFLAMSSAAPLGAQDDNGFTPRVSAFGTDLSPAEAGALLLEMHAMAQEALAASRAAERASTVAEVKAGADRVFRSIWGLPSGISGDATGEVPEHGWKTHWQVTGAEFDERWIERYGTRPPDITDPRALGLMGRGRAIRGRLEEIGSGSSRVLGERRSAADEALASLNNVIGWTYITTGLKVTEVQPRISLTHVWDAPAEFWNSDADTGWLPVAYSQAVNILKTDYAGDLNEARLHAISMSVLLERVLVGLDADRNGTVDPKPMEGGLNATVDAAARAGLRPR